MEEELSELRNVKEQMKKMEEKMNLFCLNRESNKSLIRIILEKMKMKNKLQVMIQILDGMLKK